jgi:hypothetical protein
LDESNVAQAGLFWMAKLNGSPSASWAAGWNEYDCPSAATIAGEPEICGALLVEPRIGEGLFSAGLELDPDGPPPHAARNETAASGAIRLRAGAFPSFMAACLNGNRPIRRYGWTDPTPPQLGGH